MPPADKRFLTRPTYDKTLLLTRRQGAHSALNHHLLHTDQIGVSHASPPSSMSAHHQDLLRVDLDCSLVGLEESGRVQLVALGHFKLYVSPTRRSTAFFKPVPELEALYHFDDRVASSGSPPKSTQPDHRRPVVSEEGSSQTRKVRFCHDCSGCFDSFLEGTVDVLK